MRGKIKTGIFNHFSHPKLFLLHLDIFLILLIFGIKQNKYFFVFKFKSYLKLIICRFIPMNFNFDPLPLRIEMSIIETFEPRILSKERVDSAFTSHLFDFVRIKDLNWEIIALKINIKRSWNEGVSNGRRATMCHWKLKMWNVWNSNQYKVDVSRLQLEGED